MTNESENIDKFIKLFNAYKKEQQKQKMRGLNDFNIFTTLRGSGDEVRLHSRFLIFLLDPKANHYQGDLFLRLFLEKCEVLDFFNDLSSCSVYGEYQNIDIYITDGNKHIIIENKIWAGDQKSQIKRYIEAISKDNISKDNKDLSNDDLLVMYLSIDRKEPSEWSLGGKNSDGFKVRSDGKLVGTGKHEGKEYQFLNLNYEREIESWLAKSHQEIANITNLSVGITQYQEVVQKLYGNYKGKVMNLNEYLNLKENKNGLLKTMRNIVEEYQKYRKEEIQEFFEKSFKKLSEEVAKVNQEWNVVEVNDNLKTGKRYGIPLIIRQSEETKVVFGFEFDNADFMWPYFGIVGLEKVVNFKTLENEEIKKLLEKSKILRKGPTEGWLRWDYCSKTGDLFDIILLDDNTEKAAESFTNEFMRVFVEYKDVVIKCNEIL